MNCSPLPSPALPPADGPKEYCGIFGVYGHPEAARLAYFGLYALQHRGQESCGIVVGDGQHVMQHKGLGLVPEVFNQTILDSFKGHLAIGHVRYSTTGLTRLVNAQPFLVHHAGAALAIGHNGNLVNAQEIRHRLEQDGSIFQSTMDTEVIVHLMAKHNRGDIIEALITALREVRGAYSLILITKDQVIGVRDPNGYRPLCLGKLNGAHVLASETCALDLVQAEYVRDVAPGEIVVLDEAGVHSYTPFPAVKSAFCIFEFIYFARPDSTIFGHNVYQIRKRLGQELAREHPLEADLVMPFPDSGTYAALGYAAARSIPFEMGVIRNHYVGRTFIQPSQSMRDFSVRVKLNPVKELLKGKRVVVVEDSIIRGTTSRTRVKTLREAGAKSVSMVVSCPPHRFPCYYGIDFSSKGELIAAHQSVDAIRDYLELDYLGYLSEPGMLTATRMDPEGFCRACFNGNYAVELAGEFSKTCFERQVAQEGGKR